MTNDLKARLDAMVREEQPFHTYHDYERALEAVALDLLSKLDATEDQVKALTSMKRVACCLYCGEGFSYLPGDEQSRKDAQAAILAHDPVCPKNHLVAQVKTLTAALEESTGCLNDACQAIAIYGDQPPQLYLDAIDKARAALNPGGEP